MNALDDRLEGAAADLRRSGWPPQPPPVAALSRLLRMRRTVLAAAVGLIASAGIMTAVILAGSDRTEDLIAVDGSTPPETSHQTPGSSVVISPPSSSPIEQPVGISPVQSDQRREAEETHQGALGATSWRRAGPEALLYGAGAIVVADVTSVAGPFWNQDDGQYWEPEYAETFATGDYTTPILYREITLDVTRVLEDDIGVVKGPLVILVYGGGTPAEGANAFAGGAFEEGTRVVVLLQYSVFYLREGPIDAYQPLMYVQGEVPIDAAGAGEIEGALQFESLEDLEAMIEEIRADTHAEWEWVRHPVTAADIKRSLVDVTGRK